jgi:7,8-dihydropterin-6-yl-methyl-4-(beta-D-ribofuranosyl)aminobenzene 5'-phosphate synthase
MNLGPLNLQNLVGSNRMPWRHLGEEDVSETLAVLQREDPAVVALSPHDSSDHAIERFRQAFGRKYQPLEVGRTVRI